MQVATCANVSVEEDAWVNGLSIISYSNSRGGNSSRVSDSGWKSRNLGKLSVGSHNLSFHFSFNRFYQYAFSNTFRKNRFTNQWEQYKATKIILMSKQSFGDFTKIILFWLKLRHLFQSLTSVNLQ